MNGHHSGELVTRRRAPFRAVLSALAALLPPLSACGDLSPTAPTAEKSPLHTSPATESPSVRAQAVDDLGIVDATDSTLTVEWTQVDDGTGAPAWYRLEYAKSPVDWSTAATACGEAMQGDAVGSSMACTIHGLEPGTRYGARLMSFRVIDDASKGTSYSIVSTGRTTSATSSRPGVWIGATEVAALPVSGPAWHNLKAQADRSCGAVRLSDQDQTNNVCVMAKALVFARTGEVRYLDEVLDAIRAIAYDMVYRGRALALGRELPAYVIAADLVDLAGIDPSLDEAFRASLRSLLTTPTQSGPSNLVDCHELRPNNWGTHCGAARIAVAVYLGDVEELARAARVFKGWLGDRSSYAGFSFGDLSWQCDASRPVGINKSGCMRDGHSIDGVLADDQRRKGRFTWPAPRENYVWEGLQGALAQAVMLERAGYAAFEWEDRALLRAVSWLYEAAGYPAQGDDTWQPHIVNHYYGTDFAAPLPTKPGKNVGWTDWTHG